MRKGDDLTSGALTYRIPNGLLRPVAGKLYLYFSSLFSVFKKKNTNRGDICTMPLERSRQ